MVRRGSISHDLYALTGQLERASCGGIPFSFNLLYLQQVQCVAKCGRNQLRTMRVCDRGFVGRRTTHAFTRVWLHLERVKMCFPKLKAS